MKLFDVSTWCRAGARIEDYPYLGEVNIVALDIYDVLDIQGSLYAVSMLSSANTAPDKARAGVRKIELNLACEETEYTDNSVCPYCGHEDRDSFELQDNEETTCGSCGASVEVERILSAEYTTKPIAPPTIKEAKWIEVE